jgi:DNA-binding HxlR family transcriptional regulator
MSRDQKKLAEEVNNAIRMVGDEHILCIIGNLKEGGMRFNELQRALDTNPATLCGRLTKLEELGIVNKKKETVDKLSVVYELTEKGRGIIPIIEAFGKFANKFLTN